MKIYNTLSRSLEEFIPLNPPTVTLYTCGPTVYHYAHIGNLRAYLFADTLKRTLRLNGYTVKHVLNITDVGHLVSDEDTGEDKMEKGSKREGKTAWDVAKFYTDAFNNDLARLYIEPPTVEPHATEYIQEQIDLVKVLEDKGFTYRTSQGIAYDTSKFPEYNKLSKMNLEQLKEGARVEADPKKRNITDFYLWKFSKPEENRQMEWESPWGVGFPGWHIECSAMAIKLLGETIDIHTGGPEHITVHHTNEIAQSEAATGKQFVRYWMHFNYITLKKSEKMAKSGENFLTLQRIIDEGFDPLVYRYLTLTAHYRSELEFSFESLTQATATLNNIRSVLYDHSEATILPATKECEYYKRFVDALNSDLDTPKALVVLHEVVGSALSVEEKISHLLLFDEILGLQLAACLKQSKYIDPALLHIELDDQTQQLLGLHNKNVSMQEILTLRQQARTSSDWKTADTIRNFLTSIGYAVEDTPGRVLLKKIVDN